jgi:hypothetical protein
MIRNVGVNEERVSLRVNILHHHLKPVEASGLSYLNLSGEPLCKIFEYNAVTRSEKGKHVLDEVLLALVEFLPIFLILSQVDLLCRPECRLLVLVHLPDVMVLNWEQNETIWVLFK